jgi:iron complex outermembrane recepter protein
MKYIKISNTLICTLVITSLMAQQPADTLLERALEEITVVSSRLPSGLMESSRTVYYQQLSVTNQNNQGIALDEALRYVPGVFALNALNFNQDIRIAIRGFGSRAAFGVRGIKVILDGIPATTPDGQTQLDQLDVQSLSSVEVMTGGVGGLYGNASGGSINLSTPVPYKDLVRIKTMAGSFGFLRTNVNLAKVINGWTLELGADRLSMDGYREHNGTRNFNLNSRVTYRTAKSEWQFLGQYTDSPRADDPGGISLEDVMNDRRQARAQNLSFKAGEAIRQFTGGLRFKHQLASNQLLEAKTYYIYRDFENLLPFNAGGAVFFRRNFAGLNAQYTLEKEQYRLLVGAETENQTDARTRNNNQNGEVTDLVFDQDEIFGMAGFYVLQNFKVDQRLNIDINTRLDLLKVEARDQFLSDGDQSGEINWQHFSPSLGINYEFASQQHLFAMLGHSFETPALSELSNRPDGSGGFNEDLNPQIANHYELGYKSIFGGWLFQVTGFHIDLKNELLPYELENFPGRTFYRNAGKSNRNGIEMAVNGKLTRDLRMLATYTYSDFQFSEYELNGQDLEGNFISGIPKHFGNLGFIYDRQKGAFAALDFSATGKMYANDQNTDTAEGYELIHLRGGWNFEFGKTRLKVHAGIRNLTDVEYFDNLRINAFGGRYYEPAPGRHYFGGFTVEF